MAIRYYDEAVYNKINGWVKDPNMRILKPDETSRLFQMQGDLRNDQPITLPMITLARDSSIEIPETQQKPLSYSGAQTAVTREKSKVLNAIPIKLTYQVDIYTKFFGEADEYLRNFIFNIMNMPKISIEIPYNDSQIDHNATMILESNVSDNSDIAERRISGQFTRLTLRFTLDDAYLFSVPFMDNWQIKLTDLVIDGEDINNKSNKLKEKEK